MKFRLSTRSILWEFSTILMLVPVYLFAILYRYMVEQSLGQELIVNTPTFLQYFCFSIAAIFIIAILITAIGRSIFSYLKITEDEIEYRLWPSHRIIGKWSDIDKLEKPSRPFAGEMIYLRQANVSGRTIIVDLQSNQAGFGKLYPTIPVYRFHGWREGNLKEEIKKYSANLSETENT